MSEAPTPVASPSPVLIDGADDPVTTAFLTPETVDCQPVCGYESGSPRSSVCLSADEGKVEAAPTSGFEGPEKVRACALGVFRAPARVPFR